ncbi:hypothetical protein J1614_000458 [Plenodomus biglobosus]|nr:hypothetical protein J1614_000458 [Plenodomus biglobosus]
MSAQNRIQPSGSRGSPYTSENAAQQRFLRKIINQTELRSQIEIRAIDTEFPALPCGKSHAFYNKTAHPSPILLCALAPKAWSTIAPLMRKPSPPHYFCIRDMSSPRDDLQEA